MAVDLSEFVEVKETNDVDEVNEMINGHWTIIDTYVNYEYINDRTFTSLMYSLGRTPTEYEGIKRF